MQDHFTLTLNGSAQRLSSVCAAAGVPEDRAYRFISVQPDAGNTHVIYVGGYPRGVSSSAYGFRLEAPATSIPPAPSIIELSNFAAGTLQEWQVLGTDTEKLHIFVKT